MKLRLLLSALLLGALPLAATNASVDVSINIAPPVLPVYDQPLCPVDGYLWTPGYWGYGDYGYYWVPGVWVAPPRVGFLWTPGYWGYDNGLYAFNAGYWGPTVGFYGGVNYGYGYGGYGYGGGRWDHGAFRYNTAVTHVNTTVVHNTYVDRTVIKNYSTHSRASFNGPGGVNAHPDARQLAAAREEHVAPTAEQMSHRQEAAASHKGPAAAAAAPGNEEHHNKAQSAAQNEPRPEARAEKPEKAEKPAKAEHQARAERPPVTPSEHTARDRGEGQRHLAEARPPQAEKHVQHAQQHAAPAKAQPREEQKKGKGEDAPR